VQQPRFVLAWVTPIGANLTAMGQGGRVLFVEHPTRGWEIPGGHLEANETPEQALHRELEEETGLSGVIRSWNKSYYPEGWVAHVEVEDDPMQPSWTVDDRGVASVAWWTSTPPTIEWTTDEFEDLALYFSSIEQG